MANMSPNLVFLRKSRIVGYPAPSPQWAYSFRMTDTGLDLASASVVYIYSGRTIAPETLPLNEDGGGVQHEDCCRLFLLTGNLCESTCLRRLKKGSNLNLNMLENNAQW